MGTVKVSITLEESVVEEARQVAGEGGFSSFVNDAVALQLQRLRIEQLAREMEEEFGPVPEEIRREIAAIEWPE